MTDKRKKKSQKVTAIHPDVILVASKTNKSACLLKNIRKQETWLWQVKWGKYLDWVEDGGIFLPWLGAMSLGLKPLPLTKITLILTDYDDDD